MLQDPRAHRSLRLDTKTARTPKLRRPPMLGGVAIMSCIVWVGPRFFVCLSSYLPFPLYPACPARPDGAPAAQEFFAGSRQRLKEQQGQPLPQQQQTQHQQQQHRSSSYPPPTGSRSSRHGQVTVHQ